MFSLIQDGLERLSLSSCQDGNWVLAIEGEDLGFKVWMERGLGG